MRSKTEDENTDLNSVITEFQKGIRARREAKKLSLQDVGDLMGVSKVAVHKWETLEKKMTIARVLQFGSIIKDY